MNAKSLYGVSNLYKLVQGIEPARRDEAVRSLIFDSQLRAHDPIGGFRSVVQNLQNQVYSLSSALETISQQNYKMRKKLLQLIGEKKGRFDVFLVAKPGYERLNLELRFSLYSCFKVTSMGSAEEALSSLRLLATHSNFHPSSSRHQAASVEMSRGEASEMINEYLTGSASRAPVDLVSVPDQESAQELFSAIPSADVNTGVHVPSTWGAGSSSNPLGVPSGVQMQAGNVEMSRDEASGLINEYLTGAASRAPVDFVSVPEKESAQNVDLILTDFFLPMASGYDLLRRIKNSWLKEIPVFVMSAQNDGFNQNCMLCLEGGAEAVLVTPLGEEAFKRIEESLLRPHL